jgi:hypothetical protein
MLLTVGELAQRCGLDVRTLHHHDYLPQTWAPPGDD